MFWMVSTKTPVGTQSNLVSSIAALSNVSSTNGKSKELDSVIGLCEAAGRIHPLTYQRKVRPGRRELSSGDKDWRKAALVFQVRVLIFRNFGKWLTVAEDLECR